MRLPGRLTWTTLGDLLGALYRERASGVLELVEPALGRSHRILLDAGLVEGVETPLAVARLGELLREHGFIGEEAARSILQRSNGSPARRTGELLIEAGIVSAELVAAALRHQLRAKMDALFGLRDALVRFHVPRPRSPGKERQVPLSPREFLYGRPRRRNRNKQGAEQPSNRPPQPSRGLGGRPSAASGSVPPPSARLDPVRARAFETLGLERGADRTAVQRAFRQLAAKVHPDRHPLANAYERAELMRRFAELSAAYHALVA